MQSELTPRQCCAWGVWGDTAGLGDLGRGGMAELKVWCSAPLRSAPRRHCSSTGSHGNRTNGSGESCRHPSVRPSSIPSSHPHSSHPSVRPSSVHPCTPPSSRPFSIHPSVCPSLHHPIPPSFCLSNTCLSNPPSSHPSSIHPSVHSSFIPPSCHPFAIHHPIHYPSVRPSLHHPSILLSTQCLSVHSSIIPFTQPSFHPPSVHLSIPPSFHPSSICPPLHPSAHPLSASLSIPPSIPPSVHPSLHPSFYPSLHHPIHPSSPSAPPHAATSHPGVTWGGGDTTGTALRLQFLSQKESVWESIPGTEVERRDGQQCNSARGLQEQRGSHSAVSLETGWWHCPWWHRRLHSVFTERELDQRGKTAPSPAEQQSFWCRAPWEAATQQ